MVFKLLRASFVCKGLVHQGPLVGLLVHPETEIPEKTTTSFTYIPPVSRLFSIVFPMSFVLIRRVP